MLPTIIALVLALTGQATTLTCQDASIVLAQQSEPVQFVLTDYQQAESYFFPAHADDEESGTYSYSFPEDGQALQGTLYFTHIMVGNQFFEIANPDMAQCGQATPNKLYLPIINR